jgi:parallel beta-helix repeat protein
MRNYFIGFGLVLTAIFLISIAEANTIYVCPGCDIARINDAINKSTAGDTIEVRSGLYHENIELNKKVILRGIDTGKGKPILDGNGETSIILGANGSTIEGFALRNASDAGILVASNDNIIKNNAINNNSNGIKEIQSTNNSILNDTIINNKKIGIILSKSWNNHLINNYLADNTYGLSLISSDDNLLWQNTIVNNKFYGIDILNSNHNEIKANDIRNNLLIGLNLQNSLNNTLKGNNLKLNRYNFGAEGRNDIDTTNLVDGKPIYYIIGARNLRFDQQSQAGTIYCINCSDVTIENQLLTNNSAGIYFYNTTNSVIQNIYFCRNNKGIYLINSKNNNITLDHADRNDYPLYVVHSNDNTIRINMTNTSMNNYPLYLDKYSNNDNNSLINISPGPETIVMALYIPIRSAPPGAWIYVNGENLSRKTSSAIAYELPIPREGNYAVKLVKNGYHEFDDNIDIKKPILQLPSINATLAPI